MPDEPKSFAEAHAEFVALTQHEQTADLHWKRRIQMARLDLALAEKTIEFLKNELVSAKVSLEQKEATIQNLYNRLSDQGAPK